MIAKHDRLELEQLRSEYERLLGKDRLVAERLLREYYPEVEMPEYRRNSNMQVDDYAVLEEMARIVAEYINSDGYIVERIAKFSGEFWRIRPFGKRDEEILLLMVNQQLKDAGWPPIEGWSRQEKVAYARAVRQYRRRGQVEDLERLYFLKQKEALQRWVAVLGGEKVVPLKRYAKMQGESVNALRNKARRQTIPAYRQNGRWLVRMGK